MRARSELRRETEDCVDELTLRHGIRLGVRRAVYHAHTAGPEAFFDSVQTQLRVGR